MVGLRKEPRAFSGTPVERCGDPGGKPCWTLSRQPPKVRCSQLPSRYRRQIGSRRPRNLPGRPELDAEGLVKAHPEKPLLEHYSRTFFSIFDRALVDVGQSGIAQRPLLPDETRRCRRGSRYRSLVWTAKSGPPVRWPLPRLSSQAAHHEIQWGAVVGW